MRANATFGATPTGDHRAKAMMALHPGIQRLRPSAQDWNDALEGRV